MSPLLSTALAPLELSSENEKSTREEKKKEGEEFRLCLNYFKFFPEVGWVKIKKRGEKVFGDFSGVKSNEKVSAKMKHS